MSAPYLNFHTVSILVLVLVRMIVGLARLKAGVGDSCAIAMHYNGRGGRTWQTK